jgi:hypothetical protein
MLDYAALTIAFLISSVSAFYSISGLTAIFAAAKTPIIIMGTALEFGKVITTMWLRKNWSQVGLTIKTYLVISMIVLMLITSMGIFGFLSKAHLDQGVPTADIQAEISLIDEKIQSERDNIAANKLVLSQMDNSVTEILSRSQDQRGAERAVQLRKSQLNERTKLQKENDQAQKRIQELQVQRSPIAAKVRQVEAEVGPVKYIAALIYGDNPDADFLEKAVRWVIIVIVAVFDPLALALMLAVNRKLEIDTQKTQIFSQEGTEDDLPFFLNGSENEDRFDSGPFGSEIISSEPIEVIKEVPVEVIKEVPVEVIKEIEVVKEVPVEVIKEVEVVKEVPVEVIKEVPVEVIKEVEVVKEVPVEVIKEVPGPERIVEVEKIVYESHPLIKKLEFLANEPEPLEDETSNVRFGTSFPAKPKVGDQFLRVDVKPNIMYKYNGKNWSMIADELTNEKLIEQVLRGSLDMEDLTTQQKSFLKKYLKKENVLGK